MKIEQIKTSKLLPYVNNARTHSESQVAQIAASIKEFGFNNPVLIDAEGTIIAGHGRVEAARVLELESVPCIRLGHLSEHQKKAYIIADNKLALNASWDEGLLALELKELQEFGIDAELLGFTNYEVATLGEAEEENKVDQEQPKDVNFTIQFNIVFDHEEQQSDWYEFVKYLKDQYPEAETLGERLQLFIRKHGYGTD